MSGSTEKPPTEKPSPENLTAGNPPAANSVAVNSVAVNPLADSLPWCAPGELPALPDDRFLAALTEFAAAAGHEINNPLAVILGRSQQLLQQESDETRRQSLAIIASQTLRIRDMIGDLMLFADPPPPHLENVRLSDLVPQLRSACSGVAIPAFPVPAVEFYVDPEIVVRADPPQLATVLAELIRNACHPAVNASRVEVRAEVTLDSPEWCRIRVRDNGTGLSPQDLIHLFHPFYSGRAAGRGLGFGLCKAWRLTQLHGGTLKAKSRPPEIPLPASGFRTEFLLQWPVSRSVAEQSRDKTGFAT